MRAALIYFNNDKLISRGVGYVLQCARDAGHDVELLDTVWIGNEGAINQILGGEYGAVLLSATSLYWERAAATARTIKALLPDVPIILGGAHATVCGGDLLRSCAAIDYLCVGEGEGFVVEVLDSIERGRNLTNIRNLVYRVGRRVVTNPLRPPTPLDSLPRFDYEAWNPGSVIRERGNLFPGFCYVFATRGCPYSCTYCCNSSFLRLYRKGLLRTHCVDTVIAELKHLRDTYPLELAYFGDEMITFDKRFVAELFTAVHKEVGIPYGCMFRADTVDDDLVDLLRRTGCTYVASGVECGNEEFRRRWLNRRDSNTQLKAAFRLLRTIPDIWITTYNMRGFPVSFDNRLTVATRRLNNRLRPNHSQMTWFFPLPGTRLYDYCTERDLIDMSLIGSSEDYFRRSVIRRPIDPSLDTPIYK